MIVYTEQDKELVIPKGIGNFGDGGDYQEGYENGVRDQKAKLASETFTSNGSFSRIDGWNHILINVNSGSCEGVYEQGFNDGKAAQRELLVSTAVTANGTYFRVDGYNSVMVNVPSSSGSSCNLQIKSVDLTAITETITADTERPSAPHGETVYGGSISEFKALLDQVRDISIYSWLDSIHQSSARIGSFVHDNNSYLYYDYNSGKFTNLDDISTTWSSYSIYDRMVMQRNDDNLYFYADEADNYGLFIENPPGMEIDALIFDVVRYDGISAVTVNAEVPYTSGYTSGVTDGFAIGHASGYTDGFYDGHVSGVTDGFASGYASGHSDTDWATKAMVFNNSGGTWFEPDINLAYLLNGKITFDFYLTETPTTYERRMLLSNFHGNSSTNFLQVCMNDTDMDVWFRDKNGFQTITCDWVYPTAGKLYHIDVSFINRKIQLSVADGRGNSWTAATSGETDFDYSAFGQFIVNGEESNGDGTIYHSSDKLRIINISAYPYSGGQTRYYHWFDGRVKDLMGGTIFTCKKYEDGQIVDTLIDGKIVSI